MAAPKSKDLPASPLSRRLRRAGPVPAEVTGGPVSKSEGAESETEFLKRLNLVGAVGRLRKRIEDSGVAVPDRISELSPEDSLKLAETVDRIRIVEDAFEADEVRRAFWRTLEEAEARVRQVELAEAERAKRREVTMALEEIETASAAFRLAIAEGRISCDEIPYVARRKLSEIFRSLDGDGFEETGRESELKAQIAAQQAEINRLRAAAPEKDEVRESLEAEIREMAEQGRGPERYSDRPDKSERPLEFLNRVYGRYLQEGKVALYLPQLRKIDSKFANALIMACRRAGTDVGEYVPKKSAKTDEVIQTLGVEKAKEATRAVMALRMRKPKD